MRKSHVNATYSVGLDSFFGKNDLFDPSDPIVTWPHHRMCVSSGSDTCHFEQVSSESVKEVCEKDVLPERRSRRKKRLRNKSLPGYIGRLNNKGGKRKKLYHCCMKMQFFSLLCILPVARACPFEDTLHCSRSDHFPSKLTWKPTREWFVARLGSFPSISNS